MAENLTCGKNNTNPRHVAFPADFEKNVAYCGIFTCDQLSYSAVTACCNGPAMESGQYFLYCQPKNGGNDTSSFSDCMTTTSNYKGVSLTHCSNGEVAIPAASNVPFVTRTPTPTSSSVVQTTTPTQATSTQTTSAGTGSAMRATGHGGLKAALLIALLCVVLV